MREDKAGNWRRFLAPLAMLLIGGCAATPNDDGFASIQKSVRDRTGQVVLWNGHGADDHAVAESIRALLASPLTAGAAAQIALLNNHHLQATFEDLQISQADLVQAGLLKNPVFSLDVRFPDRSPARTYLDIGVAEDFLDVALLPARKRLAAEQFAQAQANVSGQVLALAAEAAKKFYAYQAAAQVAGEYQEIGRAAEAASSAAKSLHSAGNISELEFANQTAAAARAAAAALDATGQAEEAREQVNAVMGLDDAQIQWTAAAAVPEIPAVEIDAGGLEMLAARKRFDLIAARQEVEVQSQKLGLSSQYRFFQNVDVGPNAERETDGQWRVGPAVSVPVPIFDQGQASVARARAMYEQSRERLAGLEADVRSQVRAAAGRMMNARARVILYRDQVLPAEAEAARQGQLQYNGMYIGVFQLLQIRHDQIEARREYIQSLASYWSARTDLESAVGGQLPGADQGVKP